MMCKWVERNNENKKDVLEFGTEEENKCRVSRNWIGENKDAKNKIKRAGNF